MNFGGTVRLNRMGVCIIIGACCLLVLYINSNGMESLKTEPGKNTGSVNLKSLLVAAVEVAIKGGKEIAAVRNKSNNGERSKGKTKEGVNDPVTKADYNSHCVMYYSFIHSFPKIKVISEEGIKEDDCKILSHLEDNSDGTDNLSPLDDQFVPAEDVTVWIDPLDATKEFTENQLQYVTTMVCVAVKGNPIIGVIHKPFDAQTFWAWEDKSLSDNLKIFEAEESSGIRIIMSMSHPGLAKNISEQAFGKYLKIIPAAGAGYKSLEVVSRHVDAYLHMTEIKKWDICAGNAIINALGGKMTTLSNEVLDYSSEDTVNTKGVLATMEKHEFYLEKLKPFKL
ncbi:putative inositol monophosphatase 3 [Cryptotermes secundus]|uniref:Putative inositol monophosphatase 3 n=1 Tax=Cryptotermes secundus TaxID=105785 RepID=A0A2J7PCX7_9NEOP|nr:putative inositol monophosphatase 3 [Cryptotermes secundus]PNF14189.1 putative inositol monophosphatase 3 [Cryptotermes secundus]